MQTAEHQDYLRRATDATTVAQLRAIVDELRQVYPGDADAEAVVDSCLTMATGFIARGRRPVQGSLALYREPDTGLIVRR